jgi:transposase-like protein
MARHRSFSSEFKRQISREFLEGRAGMHELARRYSLSRNLIRLWSASTKPASSPTSWPRRYGSQSMSAKSPNWSARWASSPWRLTS